MPVGVADQLVAQVEEVLSATGVTAVRRARTVRSDAHVSQRHHDGYVGVRPVECVARRRRTGRKTQLEGLRAEVGAVCWSRTGDEVAPREPSSVDDGGGQVSAQELAPGRVVPGRRRVDAGPPAERAPHRQVPAAAGGGQVEVAEEFDGAVGRGGKHDEPRDGRLSVAQTPVVAGVAGPHRLDHDVQPTSAVVVGRRGGGARPSVRRRRDRVREERVRPDPSTPDRQLGARPPLRPTAEDRIAAGDGDQVDRLDSQFTFAVNTERCRTTERDEEPEHVSSSNCRQVHCISAVVTAGLRPNCA